MDKQKNIYDLLQDTGRALSGGEWPDFLRSAAWNFRFKFLAQSLIYAQRPDATACYTFDNWHKKFNRRIKAQSKGIALLDDRKDQLSLSYVFDYKDTYSPEGKELRSWQLTQANEPAVREALVRELMEDVPGADSESDAKTFYSSAVSALLDECVADTLPDLQSVRSKSRLVRFTDAKAEKIYRDLLHNSVTAVVMYRCGLDPQMDKDTFADAAFFNTDATMSILGNATQALSSRILREIALTVDAWDKAHQHEEEKVNEEHLNVSAGRGVSDPEPDGSHRSDAEQVRQTPQEVPAGSQGEPVHVAPDERRADGPSAPDRGDDAAAGERDADAAAHSEPGPHEREGEPAVDAAHGPSETSGGGTGASGDDLYLNFFTTHDMESVLLAGPSIEGGKFRIQRAFEEKAPELQKLLAREYGQGGRSFLFSDGTEGQLSWDLKGITFTAPGYNPWTLSWPTVHNRIRDLVDAGRYLDEQETLQSQRYFADQEALHGRQELGVTLRAFYSIYGAKDHDSINRNEEDLRAFIYENSKTARTHLLATFGALASQPAVLQDETALHTLTELLNALGDDSRPEFISQIPSATDLGIVNPFPREEELVAEEQLRTQPLAREPLNVFPEVPEASEPQQPTTLADQAIFGEGEVVTLSGTDYVLLEVTDDFVVLQDAEHPLFTQELPYSVFLTLAANTANRDTQANSLYSENTPETHTEAEPVKEPDITAGSVEMAETSIPEPSVLELREAIGVGVRHFYSAFVTGENDPYIPDTDELDVILADFEATGHPYYGKALKRSEEMELRTADDNLKALAAVAFRMQSSPSEDIRTAGHDIVSACCALCQVEEGALLELAKDSGWISITPEAPVPVSEVTPEPVKEPEPRPARRGENAARKSYKQLSAYAPYLMDGTLDYVRFESDTYEPLYIERIGDDEIAMAHTIEQNGGLIVDPEMVFWVDEDAKALWPVSIEQPIFGGIIQRVYDYGDTEHARPNVGLQRDLTSFFRSWMQNLGWQDHEPVRGVKRSMDGDREYIFRDGKPVLKEPEVELSDTEGSAILSELLDHYERWHGREDIMVLGGYFDVINHRMQAMELDADDKTIRDNILYAAYVIRHFFPLPDDLTQRARETSRVLSIAEEYLDLTSSLEEMGNILRLSDWSWKAGGEHALFLDLCGLCSACPELPEDIRAIAEQGITVELEGGQYQVVGLDLMLLDNEPLVNLRKISGPSDLPERTSEPLGYVDTLAREQGAVDFYKAIPALATALQHLGRPAAVTEGLYHTYDQLVLAGLLYENDRYALYPEIRQAEREQEKAVKEPTVGDLYNQFLPMVLDCTLKDRAYFNALQYADEENLKVECDAAVGRAVLSINNMQLLKLYYDHTAFHNRLHRDVLTQSREHTPQHNPEPEVDHPELRGEGHAPISRPDKETLASLLLFVTEYRSTFERQRPALSDHDSEAYRAASEFVDSRVVTDSVSENLDNIRNVVNYINAWFMPFSEGLNPEFVDATYEMLAKATQLNAEEILHAESEREEELPSEPAKESEATFESSERAGEEGQYDESSFHAGDYYEDAHTRGVITNVYIPEEGVPHESSFSLVDPDAPEDSRDAKGYVISMPVAIGRLNRGEATLSRAQERPEPSQSSADREEEEPSLFDFQFDELPSEPAPEPEPQPKPQPVAVQAAQGAVSQDERINFRLPSETVPLGGPKARFQGNVAAIRLLKDLEREERLATHQEQEILAKYVGWGGLADAFDPAKTNWSEEYRQLKDLLTEDEYEAARESTLTAFYTPPEVMDAVYQVLGNLGFRKGNILDPGCGTGSFSGRLPEAMSESKIYGIEKDSLSGRMARQLYQRNNIAIEGYEDTKLPDNFFDVAVGNVPFGNFKVPDRRYDKLNLQVHDYFFAKTLDKVRPGGVIAFITSMGTMDKQNADFRRYLSQRADLLGAIRLPNNTFKTNAGTDVTSDIIFLQKREFPRVEEAYWTELDRSLDYETGALGEEVNAYFAINPEMILGEMKEISGPHGPELACIAKADQDLKAELSRAVSEIQGAMEEPEQGLYDQEYEERERIPADPDVRNFSFTLVNDEIYFREDSEMFKVDAGKKGEERIRGLIELRDIVYALIDAQVEGYSDEAIRALQRKLNDTYDTFTAKNGLINSRGNSLVFSDDSSYYLLCSLEHVNDKGEFLGKADMFYKRTIHAHERVDHVESAQEALAVSLGERGRIDFGFMSEISGLDREKLIEQLRGQIFEDPADPGHFEIAALYLSGNVRVKLAQARAAAEEEPGVWDENVRALEAVQPKDLEPADITARLGSTWIPAEDYTQFMYELLNPPYWAKNGYMKVLYSPITNIWTIKNIGSDSTNTRATTTYGSQRMDAYEILEKTLNLKDVKVFDPVYGPDGVQRRVLNEAETMVVQEKQQQIRDAFKEWIWADPDRAERLCRVYNERFNSYVPPKFDGQLVRFHNMNPNVTMRPWQRDAVARIMYNGNTLLAHAVGAGKTWTMSAAAKEMKYLGLCNKSMIVVPNHLVGQWASAIYEQYPDARILASTKKDFETKNRKKFCSRIATGDYDIVIIGHSQFERIPLSQERQEAGIRAEIRKIMDGIEEIKAERGEHVTIKQMERMKKSLETRLDKLNNSKKRDDVIAFEQLGVDRLFVDESHDYKNLFLYTKMQNVAGISQTDSQRASDMYLKCRYIDELTGNKGNIHATGTPLSNTMAELYATQRYLQYDLLEEMGLNTFDQWASTFGETVTSIELAPEGTGYRARTRFANFFNIPELMSLYCQVADIQTADMLDLPLPTPHYENVVVPASQVQKDYVQVLSQRAKKIRDRSVKPEEDNMLCVTNDGRKLALDQRLIDPDWPDDPNSKVNACADNIHRIWTESAETKGTQLVFCDISTPTGKGFNVYDDLKEKLISRGIPAEEIRFIHEANTDAQKEALFQKVRDGEVRVLMGSTGKMGTGTNVQDRLVAGHDLDCPWRPSDLEQRAGRVIRQGNTNKDVYMYRYVTEGTFDAYLYQLVENKQRFISQIYTSKPVARTATDVDEIVLSFAEIKALASGNPLIKERVELDADIQRLQLIKARHENAQIRLKQRVTKTLPNSISQTRAEIQALELDAALIRSQPSRTADDHLLPVTVKGVTYDLAKEAGQAILNAISRIPKDKVVPIGTIRGFTLSVNNKANSWGKYDPRLELSGPGTTYVVTPSDSPVGTVVRLNNMLDSGISDKLALEKEHLADLEQELSGAQSELGKPFTRENELASKQARLAELIRLLDLDAQKPELDEREEEPSRDMPQDIKPALSDLISDASARQASQVGTHGVYSDHSFSHR